ncbi:MAG: alanine--tRNA ligase [Gammaproteobacteria bacterium]|nr:alanine--tRNA ligase [Gammaproteobacteria bacterium]NND59633.1 alanine--tRNA ligase [Gammaproteobacteria bacterium]
MKSSEVRQSFLDFFEKRGHQVVSSSPLVPANDPTLLFTNAGMVQFKDVFLGRDKRSYTRAASSQRCVRAGGKHNDLENVGYTARHHTFFEMLGNFSFGDYFKREAIAYAWEYITGTLGLPAERLWVTVYHDDDEAADIWLKEIGVPESRFSRLGEKDNFWAMGDTGPCGPCSEIFYDHGEAIAGGPPGSADEDGDRYVEIWNLVFMQYERDDKGELTPLPHPSVDTGMGLERAAAVLQGVHSNYDIDLFRGLIGAAQAATGANDASDNSLKVIADHIRASAFLITDGVLPSNEGRGYVLKRIVRRAIRHGYKLGCDEPFFHKLVAALDTAMGDAYPELRQHREHVSRTLLKEEQQFAETLDRGMGLLDGVIDKLSGKTIPGDTVFKLYDTYGFPVDLTADIARERGLTIDQPGFEAAMNTQRDQSRQGSRFERTYATGLRSTQKSEFTGYDDVEGRATIVEIYRDGEAVDSLASGEQGIIILDRTPFYAESGGQVGDTGTLGDGDSLFTVADTQKFGDAHGHVGEVKNGSLRVGEQVDASIDCERRQAIVLNHTATHLLHAALREVLGTHVVQKGSLVAPDRLRFDFAHGAPLTADQLEQIEGRVNAEIRANHEGQVSLLEYEDAVSQGALALFGEKYDDRVRVLRLGDFSMELCGGTHVRRTGDIGLFKIVSEGGTASGIRRIEALTGAGAIDYVRDADNKLGRVTELLKAKRDDVDERLAQLLERSKTAEKEIQKLKTQLVGAGGGAQDPTSNAVEVGDIKVLALRVDGGDPKMLRDAMDRFRSKLGDSVVVLGAADGDKVRLVAGVSPTVTDRVKAGELIGKLAARVGGRGGGRPDMAQAGGSDPSQLDAALNEVADLVRERLG